MCGLLTIAAPLAAVTVALLALVLWAWWSERNWD